jgi:hypothetical protein
MVPLGHSAASISARTDASPSWASVSNSTARADTEATCPSAHAVCPRTSGSESDSASTSTGTASAAPQFPNATATFRRSPAYPARRIADPRVHASHSSYVIRMSPSSDGAVVPGSGSRPSRKRSRKRSRSRSRPSKSPSRVS